ncbi:hypothetical protein GGS24DRAFT_514640 [Hypoxylon argillaceum]|nr:hypothetical protein GGS24DRAFT_514640 [Hypoxylon argillaceum]
MSKAFVTQDEAASALLAYIFSGAIGSSKGKGVGYALIKEDHNTFSWSAALEDIDAPPAPISRYLIKIDRQSKEISPPEPIVLSDIELADAILAATGQHLASSTRFTDGALSISYKVTVEERQDVAYVVQLRHHGYVASMDAIVTLISKTIDSSILPVPPVYAIPGEKKRQEAAGMGRQITRLIPGVMASTTYPQLSHEDKLIFVQKMALAFQACWQIQLPKPHLIGELIADEIDDRVVLRIGPDRAGELREAFWGTIPDWRRLNQSEATLAFLEWFKFGLFMKPEWQPEDLPEDVMQDFWRENIRVVEGILEKYS